jgi:hypothetical protein
MLEVNPVAEVPRAINSRATFLHEAQGSVEHQTLLAPPELKELDPAHLDRIVSIDKVLLGPFPYRGQLGVTVALFSVKSADLAGPYLDLLTSLADTAGVSFLAAAKPYIEPLRKGADRDHPRHPAGKTSPYLAPLHNLL